MHQLLPACAVLVGCAVIAAIACLRGDVTPAVVPARVPRRGRR